MLQISYQCQTLRLLFRINIYRLTFITDHEWLIMLAVILLTFISVAFGKIELHQQQWITKILYNTLEDYIPNGSSSTCKRDGLVYQDGLKDLKLWATQSKFTTLFQIFFNSERSLKWWYLFYNDVLFFIHDQNLK